MSELLQESDFIDITTVPHLAFAMLRDEPAALRSLLTDLRSGLAEELAERIAWKQAIGNPAASNADLDGLTEPTPHHDARQKAYTAIAGIFIHVREVIDALKPVKNWQEVFGQSVLPIITLHADLKAHFDRFSINTDTDFRYGAPLHEILALMDSLAKEATHLAATFIANSEAAVANCRSYIDPILYRYRNHVSREAITDAAAKYDLRPPPWFREGAWHQPYSSPFALPGEQPPPLKPFVEVWSDDPWPQPGSGAIVDDPEFKKIIGATGGSGGGASLDEADGRARLDEIFDELEHRLGAEEFHDEVDRQLQRMEGYDPTATSGGEKIEGQKADSEDAAAETAILAEALTLLRAQTENVAAAAFDAYVDSMEHAVETGHFSAKGIGKSMRASAKQSLLSIGQQASVKGAFEVAEGVSSYADHDSTGGGKHMAAAGKWFAVAGLAGAGAAATGGAEGGGGAKERKRDEVAPNGADPEGKGSGKGRVIQRITVIGNPTDGQATEIMGKLAPGARGRALN